MDLNLNQLLGDFLAQNHNQNPLSDDFNETSFLKGFSSFIQENNINIGDTNSNMETNGISVILELNDFYEQLMTDIETILVELNLERIELAEEIIKLINFDFLSLENQIVEAVENETSSVPKNLLDAYNPDIENISGNKISSRTAIDVLADVCNFALNIIFSYDLPKDPKRTDIEETRKKQLLRWFQILINQLLLLKEAFEEIQFEGGYLEKQDSIIKFKSIEGNYKLLKKAGRARESSIVMEYAIIMPPVMLKDIDVVKTSIDNGKINLKITPLKTKNPLSSLAQSLCFTFYEHIEYFKIKRLGSITINEILAFLAQLQFIFHNEQSEDIIDYAVETQQLDHVPLKIERLSLIKTLISLTGLTKGQVIDILSILSGSFSDNMNLWEKPLIAYQTYYYLCYPAFVGGNITYWADIIVEYFIKQDQQLTLFRQQLSSLLHTKKQYKLEKTVLKSLKNFYKNHSEAIIYETSSLYIFIEPCLINFPLNSEEYNLALGKIRVTTEILQKRKEDFLREKIDTSKRIILIAVPQYPTISGIIINDVLVLDRSLLRNYFTAGEFRRAMILENQGKRKSSDLSTIAYYSDEVEFNENFLPFCLNPAPITHLIGYYRLGEYPITINSYLPVILQDGVDEISTGDIFWVYINEIEYLLRQEFYFESALKNPIRKSEKVKIENRLIFLNAEVFRTLAFKKDDRGDRLIVLDIFKNVRVNGLSYLFLSINNLLVNVSERKYSITKPLEDIPIDQEKAQYLLEKILHDNIANFKEKSLSSITINCDLSDIDLLLVMDHLHHLLTLIKLKQYTDEDLNTQLLLITIYSSLALRFKNRDNDLHKIFLNFIDALNFNFQNQKAKNFSEEILEYCFKNHKLPTIGWLCLFKCFIKHSNIYDATFYGILFLACMQIDPAIDESFAIEALYYMMIFYRDFDIPDFVNSIYSYISSFPLEDHDKQRINFVYYSNLVKNDLYDFPKHYPQLISFLHENLKSIIASGSTSILPWLSLLYNLKLCYDYSMISSSASLMTILDILEKEMKEDEIKFVQAQVFPIVELSKATFRKALSGILAGVNYTDLSYELDNLLPMVRNVMALSLDPLDINSLLLCGLVINDQSLTFSPKVNIAEKVQFIDHVQNDILADLTNYANNVIAIVRY